VDRSANAGWNVIGENMHTIAAEADIDGFCNGVDGQGGIKMRKQQSAA
jgi:hypothetical protein